MSSSTLPQLRTNLAAAWALISDNASPDLDNLLPMTSRGASAAGYAGTQMSMDQPVADQLAALHQELAHLRNSVGNNSQAAMQLSALVARLESISSEPQSRSSSSSRSGSIAHSTTSDNGDAAASTSNKAKAICWEPCCNGRVFSSKSNLIRHQRERADDAVRLRCSFCGAAFSRSSARNAHEARRACGSS